MLRPTAGRLARAAVLAATFLALAPGPAHPARAAGSAAPDAGGDGDADGSKVAMVNVVDGIAAQVGTEVVLISDVDRMMQPLIPKMREKGATDADIEMMRSQMLDRLIERKLVMLLAKRAEIEATDPEIDEAIAAVAKENDLTTDQLRQSVEAEGVTWDAYRKRLAEEIVQRKVVGGMVRSKVTVDESEIRALYDQQFGNQPTHGEELHLQHIAIGAKDDKPGAKRAACDQVRAAYARVRGGADFLAVAKEVSQGTPDLGWVQKANLASWMLPAVDALQPGQISNVIELPVGCAVLRMVERRQIQPVTYEQAHDRLQQALFEKKFEDEYEKFIDRLKKQTYVERKGEFAQSASSDSPGIPRFR